MQHFTLITVHTCCRSASSSSARPSRCRTATDDPTSSSAVRRWASASASRATARSRAARSFSYRMGCGAGGGRTKALSPTASTALALRAPAAPPFSLCQASPITASPTLSCQVIRSLPGLSTHREFHTLSCQVIRPLPGRLGRLLRSLQRRVRSRLPLPTGINAGLSSGCPELRLRPQRLGSHLRGCGEGSTNGGLQPFTSRVQGG